MLLRHLDAVRVRIRVRLRVRLRVRVSTNPNPNPNPNQLLLYAKDEAWLPELIEYVPYYAPRLDALGPHLGLLAPHMPLLLPHMPVIARNVDAFLPHVRVSANVDVLLFYFGWVLRVPLLRRAIFLPGAPRAIALIAPWLRKIDNLRTWLPRRPVRGRSAGA